MISLSLSSLSCMSIKHKFTQHSYPAKNYLLFPAVHKGIINPSFQQNLNQKTFKLRTKARSFGPERKDHDDDDDKDHRAEETVLKLYTDIKNQNIKGVSDVIGDDCQCFCNFLSTYRLLQGKKQVLAFFYWLMKNLGKDIKIVVKPTSKDGMTVGVQWQLEWDKPQIRLGKGFSFHICHVYRGKLLIKNVEMFMEPIFHMEPLRLRTMAFAVRLAEKMITYLGPANNTRKRAITLMLLALLLLAGAASYFTQPRF